jgi:hypothetical protein
MGGFLRAVVCSSGVCRACCCDGDEGAADDDILRGSESGLAVSLWGVVVPEADECVESCDERRVCG